MAAQAPQQTGRRWQYASSTGGIENHLRLETAPMPTPKPTQHLIRNLVVGLNPVDYKITETPIIGRFAAGRPATPGTEFAGEIVVPAQGSTLQRGQLVFGFPDADIAAGGALADYTVASPDRVAVVPKGVSARDVASLPVAAVTAYQGLAPYVKTGDRIFYNGGSGGVGLIAIQVAKILGCHVTVTCSGRNSELCKSYGADEIIDYTKTDVVTALKALPKFDHIFDGVGNDKSLYWKSEQYTNPGAKYIYIAFQPSFEDISFLLNANVLPVFLGGSRRKLVLQFSEPRAAELQQVVDWVAEGKLKPAIDSRFPMEQAVEAYRKLKTGRARGKILVDVLAE